MPRPKKSKSKTFFEVCNELFFEDSPAITFDTSLMKESKVYFKEYQKTIFSISYHKPTSLNVVIKDQNQFQNWINTNYNQMIKEIYGLEGSCREVIDSIQGFYDEYKNTITPPIPTHSYNISSMINNYDRFKAFMQSLQKHSIVEVNWALLEKVIAENNQNKETKLKMLQEAAFSSYQKYEDIYRLRFYGGFTFQPLAISDKEIALPDHLLDFVKGIVPTP
jgi:hypothetical protein